MSSETFSRADEARRGPSELAEAGFAESRLTESRLTETRLTETGATGYPVESPVACADQIKALRARLLRLLSRREYSQHELRNRLLAPSRKDGSRANPVAVEEALLWAVDRDLQSDERFVEALVRRSGPRQGLAKIRAQLKVHNIDAEIINRCVDGLHESEFNRAFTLWEGRFGTKPENEREKARQFRFLVSRGFRNETAMQVLRSVQR